MNVEKATDEDLNKFYNENFYMIYGVFFDSFTAYENNCKKGSKILKQKSTKKNIKLRFNNQKGNTVFQKYKI